MWRLEVWNQGVVRTMLSFQAARKNSSLLLCSFWGLSAILGLLWLVDISLKSLPPHHHMHFCCVSQFSSVTQSCPTLWPHGLQHTRLPRPSPTPKACSNSCPTSQWCHATTSSSVIPFSFCLQYFPASGSFQMSQFFPSGGQRIGVSASASVLPMNNQNWFPLAWTGWTSLQSKGVSGVFSNTTVQKHQFFSTQLSL